MKILRDSLRSVEVQSVDHLGAASHMAMKSALPSRCCLTFGFSTVSVVGSGVVSGFGLRGTLAVPF